MTKIPFDIKYRPQIESGEYKVVCGDSNYPVTILMWDFKDPEGYCILGYYEDKEWQYAVMYNDSGKLYHDKDGMFDLLIIAPEPEVDLDFQYFVKELAEVYALPASITENTKENPLNWEYEIARHFYELGLNTRKEK